MNERKKELNLPKLNIREILAEKGVSLDALGKMTGKTRATVSNQMDGNMSLNTLKEFADAIGIEIADFFVVPENYVHWQQRKNRTNFAPSPHDGLADVGCPYCHEHFYLDPQALHIVGNDPSLLENNEALTDGQPVNTAFNDIH